MDESLRILAGPGPPAPAPGRAPRGAAAGHRPARPRGRPGAPGPLDALGSPRARRSSSRLAPRRPSRTPGALRVLQSLDGLAAAPPTSSAPPRSGCGPSGRCRRAPATCSPPRCTATRPPARVPGRPSRDGHDLRQLGPGHRQRAPGPRGARARGQRFRFAVGIPFSAVIVDDTAAVVDTSQYNDGGSGSVLVRSRPMVRALVALADPVLGPRLAALPAALARPSRGTRPSSPFWPRGPRRDHRAPGQCLPTHGRASGPGLMVRSSGAGTVSRQGFRLLGAASSGPPDSGRRWCGRRGAPGPAAAQDGPRSGLDSCVRTKSRRARDE